MSHSGKWLFIHPSCVLHKLNRRCAGPEEQRIPLRPWGMGDQSIHEKIVQPSELARIQDLVRQRVLQKKALLLSRCLEWTNVKASDLCMHCVSGFSWHGVSVPWSLRALAQADSAVFGNVASCERINLAINPWHPWGGVTSQGVTSQRGWHLDLWHD